MSDQRVCNVRSQTCLPSSSAIIDFIIPGLDRHHFVAWGTLNGLIEVGYYQTVPSDHSNSFSTIKPHLHHLITLEYPSDNDTQHSIPILRLAYGGGPHILLAASTSTSLAVFTLESLLTHIYLSDSNEITSGLEARAYRSTRLLNADAAYLLGTVNCTASEDIHIIDISWTQQLDGILTSDTSGQLIMWQIKPIVAVAPPAQSPSSSHTITNLDDDIADGDNHEAGSRSMAQYSSAVSLAPETPSASSAQLRRFWSVRAPEPQNCISAGVSIDTPSASCCSIGDKNANIWWPDTSENGNNVMHVNREKLKHACHIESVEWCPGVLRKDIFAIPSSSSSAAAAAAAAAGNTTDEQAAVTPPITTHINTASPMSAQPQSNNEESPQQQHIEDHPALMTVGRDGVVRLWVEMLVVQHVPLPPQQQPSASSLDPGELQPRVDSYFAMSLVIDAPSEYTAAAAASTPSSDTNTPGGSRNASIHRKITVRWATSPGSILTRKHKVASSSVLWLVSATQVSNETDDSEASNINLRLYVVRGLSAVIVASFPGRMSGASTLNTGSKRPQAVLWGKHSWDNGTMPFTVDNDGDGDDSGTIHMKNTFFSSWLCTEDDFPKIKCFHSSLLLPQLHLPACLDTSTTLTNHTLSSTTTATLQNMNCTSPSTFHAASVTFATVETDDAPLSPTSLHKSLHATETWKSTTTMHSCTIQSIDSIPAACEAPGSDGTSVAAAMRMSIAVDAAGYLSLWSHTRQDDRCHTSNQQHHSSGGSDHLESVCFGRVPSSVCFKDTVLDRGGSLPCIVVRWLPLSSGSFSRDDAQHYFMVVTSTHICVYRVNSAGEVGSRERGDGGGGGKENFSMECVSFMKHNACVDAMNQQQESQLSMTVLAEVFKNKKAHGDQDSALVCAFFSQKKGHPIMAVFDVPCYTSSSMMSTTRTTTLPLPRLLHVSPLTQLSSPLTASKKLSFTQSNLLAASIHKRNTNNSLHGSIAIATHRGELYSVLLLAPSSAEGSLTPILHALQLPRCDFLSQHRQDSACTEGQGLDVDSLASSNNNCSIVDIDVDKHSGIVVAALHIPYVDLNKPLLLDHRRDVYRDQGQSHDSYVVAWQLNAGIGKGSEFPGSAMNYVGTTCGDKDGGVTEQEEPLAVIKLKKESCDERVCRVAVYPGFIVPCICVASTTGRIGLYAPTRCSAADWQCIAEVPLQHNVHPYDGSIIHLLGLPLSSYNSSSSSRSSIQEAIQGTNTMHHIGKSEMLIVFGSRLCILSDYVVAADTEVSLSRHLVNLAGPLPQYHPKTLVTLLKAGKHAAVLSILKALVTWLPQHQRYHKQKHLVSKLYRSTSETAGQLLNTVAGMTASNPVASPCVIISTESNDDTDTTTSNKVTPTVGAAGVFGGDPSSVSPSPLVSLDIDAALLGAPPVFPLVHLDAFLDKKMDSLPEMFEECINEMLKNTRDGSNGATHDFSSSTTIPISMPPPIQQQGDEKSVVVDQSVASGMIDFSSFGGDDFGMIDNGSVPPPVQQQTLSNGGVVSESGMIDLAAFGMSDFMPLMPETNTASMAIPLSSGVQAGSRGSSTVRASMSINGAGIKDTTQDVSDVVNESQQSPYLVLHQSYHHHEQQQQSSSMVNVPSIMKFITSDILATLKELLHVEDGAKKRKISGDELDDDDEAFGRLTRDAIASGNRVVDSDIKNILPLNGIFQWMPTECLPELSLLETQQVLALTALFSDAAGLDGTGQGIAHEQLVDHGDMASTFFLTGLSIACCARNALELHFHAEARSLLHQTDYQHTTNGHESRMSLSHTSLSPSSSWSSVSSMSFSSSHYSTTINSSTTGSTRRSRSTLLDVRNNNNSDTVDDITMHDRGSTSSRYNRVKSMKNAAGVEYTLQPAMASGASLARATSDGEFSTSVLLHGTTPYDDDGDDIFRKIMMLLDRPIKPSSSVHELYSAEISSSQRGAARRWGLLPGLDVASIFWAVASTSYDALLHHGLEKYHEYVAAVESIEDAAMQGRKEAGIGKDAFVAVRSAAPIPSGGKKPLTWHALRSLGVGFWLEDEEFLKNTAENVAKATFASTRKADDVALLYAALGKKSVLQGLYRSTQHLRQAEFLSRDFSQSRHKEAACKNAFVLMGQHRYKLAAAFFIFGGAVWDAACVCTQNLHDIQLALLVVRLVKGCHSHVEHQLIDKFILQPLEEQQHHHHQQSILDKNTASLSKNNTTDSNHLDDEALWIRALGYWLQGNLPECLSSLLSHSHNHTNRISAAAATTTTAPTSNAVGFRWYSSSTLSQLVPLLFLLSHTRQHGTSSAAASFLAVHNDRQQWSRFLYSSCISGSNALLSMGLPVLSLQLEAMARQYVEKSSAVEHHAEKKEQQEERMATLCAWALLPHPLGNPATSKDIHLEQQLSTLRTQGYPVDSATVIHRLRTLRCAVLPWTFSSSQSVNTPRALSYTSSSATSIIFRQHSMDGQSMHSASSSMRRGSLDVGTSSRGQSTARESPSLSRSTSSIGGPDAGGAVVGGGGGHQTPQKHSHLTHPHRQGHHHTASNHQPQQRQEGPLQGGGGTVVFQVDGDQIHGVCACPLIAPDLFGRPLVVATQKHGLLEFAMQGPPTPPKNSGSTLGDVQSPRNDAVIVAKNQAHTEGHYSPLPLPQQHQRGPLNEQATLYDDLDKLRHDKDINLQSDVDDHDADHDIMHPTPSNVNEGIFSRFLSQIFDQTSWLHDPLERSYYETNDSADGDVGLAIASAMASASSGVVGVSTQATGPSGSPFHHQDGDSHTKQLQHPHATRAFALAAHPTRQIFLSGCEATGKILLWRFGGPQSVSSFTPVSPSDLSATREDIGIFSFSARFSRSASLTARLGGWGGVRSLTFTPNGERFAGIGEGGVVAMWRLNGGGGGNRMADDDGALCAEWWHHCLSKRGCAVTHVGGGGSVLAVSGTCSAGNISLWDTSSPPSEACVGRLTHHGATVTTLCTLPGGWLLGAGDASGGISLSDIRMLGGTTGGARTLWSVRAAKGGVHAVVPLSLGGIHGPRALALGAASGGGAALVSGGEDGVVRVWSASTGKLLQSLEHSGASGAPKRLSLGGVRESSVGGIRVGVTGLSVCEEGVVSCGSDGTVRLFSRAAPQRGMFAQ